MSCSKWCKTAVCGCWISILSSRKSTIFQKYPLVLTQKRLVTFIADNFRLMAMGKIDAHELEGILDQELDTAEESC